jgi:chaperonin GroEL
MAGKVLNSSILENAVPVSGMLLTTEFVITEVKSAEPAMPMGGGMPRMM